MAFLGDLYDFELSRYGVTFCDDLKEGDRLFIAPGLRGHPADVEDVRRHSSPIETVEYLFIGDRLVGVAYQLFAGFINYFFNGKVPDEIPMQYVTDLAMLGIHDPIARSRFEDEEYERTLRVYSTAGDLIASMPPIPVDIIDRIREHLAEEYITETVH